MFVKNGDYQREPGDAVKDGHALIRFNIPAEFVLKRVLPTGAEIAYGYKEGWITRDDVVALALAKYEVGAAMSNSEEELALLLLADYDRVDDLVDDLELVDAPTESRTRCWLLLALAWVLEHRGDCDDPFEVIEMLYADFDYPEEIRPLVRFMPAAPGEDTGLDAIDRRWREFVDRAGAEYRERSLASE